jgi:hypothetical protein
MGRGRRAAMAGRPDRRHDATLSAYRPQAPPRQAPVALARTPRARVHLPVGARPTRMPPARSRLPKRRPSLRHARSGVASRRTAARRVGRGRRRAANGRPARLNRAAPPRRAQTRAPAPSLRTKPRPSAGRGRRDAAHRAGAANPVDSTAARRRKLARAQAPGSERRAKARPRAIGARRPAQPRPRAASPRRPAADSRRRPAGRKRRARTRAASPADQGRLFGLHAHRL